MNGQPDHLTIIDKVHQKKKKRRTCHLLLVPRLRLDSSETSFLFLFLFCSCNVFHLVTWFYFVEFTELLLYDLTLADLSAISGC